MVEKTFNIYCDESTHLEHDGHPYMLYGCVSIASNQIKICKEQIKAIKKKYGYTDELKWINVHERTLPVYKELVEYFFLTDMQFRVVIADKTQIDASRLDYTFEDFYIRMYFQLLHHDMNLEHTYNIYFDIKDTCSQEKLHRLRDALKWNVSIRNFQFIKSHESVFVQLADVLIGAINYQLRIQKGDIDGKVIAKRKITEIINSHTPITLRTASPLSSKKFNLSIITLK